MKANRQFEALRSDERVVKDLIEDGYSEQEAKEAIADMRATAERMNANREAAIARGDPFTEEEQARIRWMTDSQFAGMPGYHRNHLCEFKR